MGGERMLWKGHVSNATNWIWWQNCVKHAFTYFWEISLKLKHTHSCLNVQEDCNKPDAFLSRFYMSFSQIIIGYIILLVLSVTRLHAEINQHHSRICHLDNNSTFDLTVCSKIQKIEMKNPSKIYFKIPSLWIVP